ncbi:MAG: efflux RND transporter periplasmic adaptor subunit [Bacteroidota bacterium]
MTTLMAQQRNIRPRKQKKSTWWIWLLAGSILALTTYGWWKGRQEKAGEKVVAEAVAQRTITETVAASGKIFPQTEVGISSDVSGEIIELYVQEGDSVQVGQLLARIEPDAYQSQVEQGLAGVSSSKAQLANAQAQVLSADASLERAEADLVNAQQNFQRFKKLYEEGAIASAEFEGYEAQLKLAQVGVKTAKAGIESAKKTALSSKYQVQSAQANLKQLQTNLDRTSILAPLSGVISLLNVEKGERVVGTIQMTGTEMMRIANLGNMEVQVEVSESDIPRVAVGNSVDVEVDAYLGRTFKGKVAEIANTASGLSSIGSTSLTSDQVVNFVVKVDMAAASYADLISDSSPFPFRPGMSASVEIQTQTIKNALSVPIQAVTTREEEDKDVRTSSKQLREVVFVIHADTDTVQLVEVTTAIQDDEYIIITKGLNAGQNVVTAPYDMISRKLSEGDKVEIVSEEALYKSKKK